MHEYSAVRDSYALPREASVLGDVLEQMSFDNVREYPWNLLTDEQARLLQAVFDEASTYPLLSQHVRITQPIS
jgi:hypothetical protein